MTFTVIIPSYESGNLLDLCVKTILGQAGESVNVVVVDSSSDGVDPEIKNRFQQVKFIETHQRMLAGAARNLGARHSKSEWLIFLDADCIWADGWWQEAKHLVQMHPDKDAFIGKVLPEAVPGTWSYALHMKEFHEFQGESTFEPRFVSSGNLLIKRSVFELVGGFPEEIPMCQDFCFLDRYRDRKFETLYSPRLAICHRDHLTDERKIKSKVQMMGYWRGKVDRDLSQKLRLPKWVAKLDRISLGVCFSGMVFLRLAVKSPKMLLIQKFPFLKLLKLNFIWAKGLHLGLSERKV